MILRLEYLKKMRVNSHLFLLLGLKINHLNVLLQLYYTFLGMKKADGMNRRLMLKSYEGNNYQNNGLVYPIANWTQKDVLAYMRQSNLPEPIRYSLKASSGAGFNLDCFLLLRENYPQDLQKIYKTFPMSERILFEYDNKQK